MATCNECRWKVERHECPWDLMYKGTDYAEDCIDFRNINRPYDAFECDKRDIKESIDERLESM